MAVTRFGVSLEEETLNALDEYVKENNFANRSRALRFLIEKHLVEKKWKCDNIVAGVVTLVYEGNKNDIMTHASEILEHYKDFVLSEQRYWLNEQNIMEVIVVKGPSHILTEFSDQLNTIKGLQHGKLAMSKA